MDMEKQLYEIFIDENRLPGHGVSVLIRHDNDLRDPKNYKLYASAYCTSDDIWAVFMDIYKRLDIRHMQLG